MQRLYEAGMDVARINMSHADRDDALQLITWIKTLNRKVKYPIPILLDTQGPEIRTGTLETPMQLESGQEVFLSVANGEGANTIFVNYPEMVSALEVGDKVRLDNGLINATVLAKEADRLKCRVDDGGTLGSRKHVNLPGTHVNLPAIT
ncbi:MAG: pyruvate kinase, partial [Gammaproteobacteria bacterium]|nr:pyruvate kinase [Gammaproteobacteria bacterium]